jgi:hypothetical protein
VSRQPLDLGGAEVQTTNHSASVVPPLAPHGDGVLSVVVALTAFGYGRSRENSSPEGRLDIGAEAPLRPTKLRD